MADKTVLAQGNVLADESVGLYFGSVANDTSFLYLNKWPDKNIIAQGTAHKLVRSPAAISKKSLLAAGY
jgi:hypothetical protein